MDENSNRRIKPSSAILEFLYDFFIFNGVAGREQYQLADF
jgi:hypothetical protein